MPAVPPARNGVACPHFLRDQCRHDQDDAGHKQQNQNGFAESRIVKLSIKSIACPQAKEQCRQPKREQFNHIRAKRGMAANDQNGYELLAVLNALTA